MNTIKTPPTTPQRKPRGRPLKGNPTQEMQEMTPAQRGDLALLLRTEGLSWTKIAERLGYSTRSACWNAAMRRALYHTPVSEAQRDAERRRLATQLEQLFTQAVEPALASDDAAKRSVAIEQARKIIDIYARWFDVAPSQTPLAERLPQYGLAVKP